MLCTKNVQNLDSVSCVPNSSEVSVSSATAISETDKSNSLNESSLDNEYPLLDPAATALLPTPHLNKSLDSSHVSLVTVGKEIRVEDSFDAKTPLCRSNSSIDTSATSKM